MAAIELDSTPLRVDANLSTYYRLENVSASVGGDLTNNNTVTFSAAKFNNGAVFSSNKYLSLPNSFFSDVANWTISMWIKTGSTNQGPVSVFANGLSNTGGVQIYQSNTAFNSTGDELIVNFGGVGTLKPGFTFSDTSTFHHLVVTRDATTTKAYFDGVISGTTSALTPAGPSTASALGAKTDGSENWAGTMDDVAIFSRALTADEVSNLYNGTWPLIANGHFYFM